MPLNSDSKKITTRPRGSSFFRYVPSPRKVSLAELEQVEAPDGENDDDSDVSPVDSALNMFAHYETDETDTQNLTKAEYAKSRIDHIPLPRRISIIDKAPIPVSDTFNNARMKNNKSRVNISAMKASHAHFRDYENELTNGKSRHIATQSGYHDIDNSDIHDGECASREEIEDMRHVEELKRIEGVRHSKAMRHSQTLMDNIHLASRHPSRHARNTDTVSVYNATPSGYKKITDQSSLRERIMLQRISKQYENDMEKNGDDISKHDISQHDISQHDISQHDISQHDIDIEDIRHLEELERIEEMEENVRKSVDNEAKKKRCCKKPRDKCCEERVKCSENQIKKLEETQLPSRMQVKEHKGMCCGQRRYSLETDTLRSCNRDSTSTSSTGKPLGQSCCSGTSSMLDEKPRYGGFRTPLGYRSRGARSSAYSHPGVLPPYAACRPSQLPACNNPNCPRPNSELEDCLCSDRGSTISSGLGNTCSKCKEDAPLIDLRPNSGSRPKAACGWDGHTNKQFDDMDLLNHERDRLLQKHAGSTIGALNLYKALSATNEFNQKLKDSKANTR